MLDCGAYGVTSVGGVLRLMGFSIRYYCSRGGGDVDEHGVRDKEMGWDESSRGTWLEKEGDESIYILVVVMEEEGDRPGKEERRGEETKGWGDTDWIRIKI